MHTVGPRIWRENLKITENEKYTLQDPSTGLLIHAFTLNFLNDPGYKATQNRYASQTFTDDNTEIYF